MLTQACVGTEAEAKVFHARSINPECKGFVEYGSVAVGGQKSQDTSLSSSDIGTGHFAIGGGGPHKLPDR